MESKGFSLGNMPITLFIVIAAILAYLRLAGRQNAQQGGSNALGGASGGGKVTIPAQPQFGLPGLQVAPHGKTQAEEYFDRYGTLRGFQGRETSPYGRN